MNFCSWPAVDDEHIKAVDQVARSGRWHYGTIFRELEQDLDAEYERFAVTTSSCAWAIFLALRSIDTIKAVAVPAYTYHGTVHPIIWAGARPVFVDVDPRTYNICPDDLERTIKRECIDAVLGVHIHGLPFSADIQNICHENSIILLEDVCQAQGASVLGRKAGELGTAAAFSFNNRKTMPAGLGGAVLFKSEEHALRAKEIRDYGKRNQDGLLDDVGSYLPIGEFDAALARVQLKRLPNWINHANQSAKIIGSALGSRAPYVPAGYTHTWHKYRIVGTPREKNELDRRGIITSTWINAPLTKYPAYRAFVSRDSYPGAEQVCNHTFLLFDDDRPLVAQTHETIEMVATILAETLL